MHTETKTAEAQVIYAITNLESEYLGSSIIKTYSHRGKAFEEISLIESGEHPEFLKQSILDVFEIPIPEDLQTTPLLVEIERLKAEIDKLTKPKIYY